MAMQRQGVGVTRFGKKAVKMQNTWALMTTKHPYLRQIAFIFLAALASSSSIGASLQTGETRFPSGVVVRIDEAASSVEEYKKRLAKRLGGTFEEMRKRFDDLKSAVSSGRLQTKLEIVNASNHSTQDICDEYIVYYYQFFAKRALIHAKEVEVDVVNRGEEGLTCVYSVSNGPILTHKDGSLLPALSLQDLHLDGSEATSVALLGESFQVGMRLPLQDVLVITPIATTEMPTLAVYLTRVAERLYSNPTFEGKTINFIPTTKGDEKDAYILLPAYILPVVSVMAIKTSSGSIIFIDAISYLGKLVAISVWNPSLAKVLASGVVSADFFDRADIKQYASTELFSDSEKTFDAIGRIEANVWGISMVMIENRAVVSQPAFDVNLPVLFSFNNGMWSVVRKKE